MNKKEFAKYILSSVQAFVENSIKYGKDPFGDTPLFADGINLHSMEPVFWLRNGERWIISNLANQQNFLRTLVNLTTISSDQRYRDFAEQTFKYHFGHIESQCGLLKWGGHTCVDLSTGNFVGEVHQGYLEHEFKLTYPFYDLMWEVDPLATEKFIKALWNSHVLDWSNLDMNRHGSYDLPLGDLWDSDWSNPEPFFEGKGLTFINIGSDLIYAAAHLYKFTKDKGALEWGVRLWEQYEKARDPNTGLGAYQYTQPIQEFDPDEFLSISDFSRAFPDRDVQGRDLDAIKTASMFGDRAKNQFSAEFGDRALEGKMLTSGGCESIYGNVVVSQLGIIEQFGPYRDKMLDSNISGLKAFGKYAYDHQTNQVSTMLTDGTILTPDDIKRPGYYSRESLQKSTPDPILFLSNCVGFHKSNEEPLWKVIRIMARGYDLGDFGESINAEKQPNLKTQNDDPICLIAILELLKLGNQNDLESLACAVAQNIISNRFHNGFFVPSKNHLNARLDSLEALALTCLAGYLYGFGDQIAEYAGSDGFFHVPFDGISRTDDKVAIWNRISEA
ncbi:MAG: hypothetical protein CL786_05590 [Chloroflexi bacterium]|nr:hypothetical protein [Chloroflexota bacterium]